MKTTCTFLILFPLSFLICVHGQTKKRNVHDYAAGAVYDERSQLSNPTAAVRKSAKAYLLEAWKKKKQVYFKVIRYSREGVKTSCLYFVEKSSMGTWQVATQCSSDVCPVPPGRRCVKGETVENVYDVIDDVSVDAKDNNQQVFYGPALLIFTNSKTGQKHQF
jgi:hypothetical protein